MADNTRIEELEAPARELSAEETDAVSGGAASYGDAFQTPEAGLAFGGNGGAGKAFGAGGGGGAGKTNPEGGAAFGSGGGAGK